MTMTTTMLSHVANHDIAFSTKQLSRLCCEHLRPWIVPFAGNELSKGYHIMKHQNTFVAIVGLAAWIHSTWSFSVVIGGEVPPLAAISDAPRWLYWVLPGAAAAAAVDVGLISLAAQFKAGRGNRAKLVTFAVLSFISYLGQALFSLSHGGRYVPSGGLSVHSVAVASVVWEGLIWALPAALPITLILWAWSDMRPAERADSATHVEPLVETVVVEPTRSSLDVTLQPALDAPHEFTAVCEFCGWTTEPKPFQEKADQAMRMHHQRHCTKIKQEIPQ